MRMPIAALPSSQAIVVLSGMLVQPPGDAPLGEWSEAVDRFEAGIALFQAGKAPVLVCTGGGVPRSSWRVVKAALRWKVRRMRSSKRRSTASRSGADCTCQRWPCLSIPPARPGESPLPLVVVPGRVAGASRAGAGTTHAPGAGRLTGMETTKSRRQNHARSQEN